MSVQIKPGCSENLVKKTAANNFSYQGRLNSNSYTAKYNKSRNYLSSSRQLVDESNLNNTDRSSPNPAKKQKCHSNDSECDDYDTNDETTDPTAQSQSQTGRKHLLSQKLSKSRDTNSSSPQNADLNEKQGDSLKSHSSRCSCSSSASSSGIGSASGNIFIGEPKNDSGETLSETNEPNIDWNSNYDAENEDEIDDMTLSSDVKLKTKDTTKKLSQSVGLKKRVGHKKINDKLSEESMVNSLFRTMNEILTSQLVLSRKVDSIGEKFSGINTRLKDIEFTCKRSLKMNRQNKLLYTNSPRISIQQESRNSQLTDQITMKPLSLDTIIDSSIHRAASPNKSSLSVYNDQNSLDSSLKRKHSPLKSSLLQVPNHMDNFTSPNNEPTSNKTSSSTTPNTQHNDKTSGSKNHALSVSSLTDGMSTGLNYMQPSKQHAWNQTSPNKLMEQPAKCHTNNKSKSEIDDSTRYLRHLFQNKMSRCFNEKHSGTIDSNDGKHSFRDQISPNQIKVEANSSSNNMESNNTNNIIGNINSTGLSNKHNGMQFSNQNYPFLGHQTRTIRSTDYPVQLRHGNELSNRQSSPAQMPHLMHSQQLQQQSHSRFSHPFLQASTSVPSSLLTNSSSQAKEQSITRNLQTIYSAPSDRIQGQIGHMQQGSSLADNMRTSENFDNNDEIEYDSPEEDDENSYHQSNQQRETMEQAASFIIQQHGLVKHVPSGSVDQLELDEESERLVSREVIKRCVRKAKHRGNFAANLAAELFTKEERVSCNCTGTRGKRQLSPRRLQLVKEITFRMYNTNHAVLAAASSNNVSTAAVATAAVNAAYHDFEEAWRKECITAIDAKNRSIGRDLIKTFSEGKSGQITGGKDSMTVNIMDNNTSSPGAASTPDSANEDND